MPISAEIAKAVSELPQAGIEPCTFGSAGRDGKDHAFTVVATRPPFVASATLMREE